MDGVPLDTYCETQRLPLAKRLHLFRQVCAAVGYAHRRLVIHRDIKCRNILVTSEGTPKLLDFGIAKLLDRSGLGGQTRTGQRAFTLEHASPEQIRGEPMAVTSDVYALGVLLYQLLTGQRPCGSTAVTDTDVMRAICEDPPSRPTDAARSGTGFAVSPELEWILLKAIRKGLNTATSRWINWTTTSIDWRQAGRCWPGPTRGGIARASSSPGTGRCCR